MHLYYTCVSRSKMSSSSSSLYDRIRYDLVPPAFLVLFTVLTQVLVVIGNPEANIVSNVLGSAFAWKVVVTFYIWAFASIKLSGKEFKVGGEIKRDIICSCME